MHRSRHLVNLIFVGFLLFLTSIATSASLPIFGNYSASTSITTNNIPNPWTYGVNLTTLQIYLKTRLSSAKAVQFQIQNSQGERYINYQVQGAASSEGVVSGNTITYPNVFNYTNITYTIGPSELSKTITISNESAPTNFTFKLQVSGVDYNQTSAGGVNFFDETTGERLWSIQPPSGFDSSPTIFDNETLNISSPKLIDAYYTISQSGPNIFLNLIINETNMSQFTYPLFIDPTTQSACGTLDIAGETYTLNQNVSTSSTCFTIDADNITLDCQSYNITGDGGFSDYGINIATKNNITVKNCNLYNFGAAIRLTTSTRSFVENNTVNNTYYYGIYLTAGHNNTIRNNTANSSKYGTYLTSTSDNNLTNNTFKSQEYYGIYLEYSQGNRIINNTAQESGTLDVFNSASSTTYCNNNITDTIGSGGLPVNYTNSSVTWGNFTASEILLCNADNSVFSNLTITGSSTLFNNGIFSYFTDSSSFTQITSNWNKYGIHLAAYPNSGIAVNYNNITSSTFINNSYGIQLSSANLSTVSNNQVHNNTIYGIILGLSFLNNLTNNTLENNTGDAFYVQGTNNTFENNTLFLNKAEGFEFYKPTTLDEGRYNTVRYNNISNTTGYAFHLRSGAYYNTIASNYIFNSNYAAYLNAGYYTNFTNNTIVNYVNNAFYLSSSDENNFFNNTISDTDATVSYAIYVYTSSDRNVFDNNTISWRASLGIYLSNNIVGNRVTNNKILTGTSYGLYANSSHSNISYNKIDNITQYGIYLTGDNNTIAYNNISNVTASAEGANFYSHTGADNNTFISNLAIDAPFYGFWFNDSNNISLINNNATNSTIFQYYFNSNSNATFIGNNYATSPYNLSTNDIIIANGSNVTTLVSSTYNNFTTSYGTIFFDNAINVSIKLMNLTDSAASSTGCSGFSGTCTLITPSTNVVNITNQSVTATIILGMYYDTSSNPTSSNLYIGKYDTANSGWLQVGQTHVDTSAGTVRYGAITSFSTFGIVNFVAASPSPPSGDSSSSGSLSISYDFTCESGLLEVSSTEGAEVSLVELSPNYLQLEKKEVDSDGNALFTIPEDGTYKIRATKSGYTSAEKDNLKFNLCEEVPEPESDEKFEPELFIPYDPQSEALKETNKAQEELTEAKKQRKDINENASATFPGQDQEKKLEEQDDASSFLMFGAIVIAVSFLLLVIHFFNKKK